MEEQLELQKSPSKPVVTEETVISDEGPLINENSNGLSHLLSDGGFSLEGTADESSNFLTVADLPETADYFEDHSQGFTARTFDAGDNAVGFQENSNSGGITETSQPVGESDGSRNCNDNDDSNVPERGSAINTQDILNDIESEDFQVLDETPMEVDETQMEKSNSLATLNAEESQNSSDRKDPDKSEKRKNHVEARETNQSEPDEDSRTDLKEKSQIEPDVKSQTEIKVKSEHVPGVKSQHVPEVKSHDEAEVKSQVDPEVISLDEPKAKSHAEAEEKETTPLVMEVQETDTEVVSEDELPAVEKPSVQDAENVSDDELPGPKPADLPADTEVVSEDELPTSKKDKEQTEGSRKRKPEDGGDGGGSPVSDAESSSKKQAIVKNGESKPVAAEKRSSVDEKPKKKLPELDKYWKVVNDDPTDFTGWTYLLQYVDQESDVEAAREAYDAFLSHYPYCYGYWRKYADYEKRKGSKKKCFEVLERGLKAIPLSVDLWIHYLNHIKNTKGDEHTFIRQQYDRAIEACGLEFRSDRLWESYIKWESEHGAPLQVTNIYGRLLATPTLGYTGHFDNFQEHVMSENVTAVIDREELVKLRAEVREGSGATPAADLPPGEDEPVDHIANEEEAQAIKERVIALRRKVHKLTGEQVAQRWTFEEGIKRPYFHVKPLERIQLKNWKAYLEWEKQHGSLKRALVLHERCLIACALYEEFWLRLVKFLEEKCEEDPSLVALEREVLERACTVHHLDKPALHLHWAYFEEVQGNAARAADILDRLEKTCPNLVQVAYRRINLERRRGELDKCVQLYETYINSAKSKAIASALAIKYARFLHHARGDSAGAQRVLAEALAKDPLQSRLYLQQLDIALHTPGTAYQELAGYLEAYEKQEGAEPETCAALAWRRLELAEERGSAAAARGAYQHQRSLARHLGKRFRQAKHEATAAAIESKKKESVAPSSSSSGSGNPPSAPTGGGGGGGAGSAYYPPQAPPAQPYDQAAYQQPYQPQWNHYQQPPNPYGHNPWGQYTNYY